MAFVPLANALVLLQLSLLLCRISTTVYGDATLANHYPPAEAPHPHHHHHHHHHPTPAPSPAPVKPPVHPPVKHPVHPPVKPPVHPPVKPPIHSPVKPPVHSPVKPPAHPPVKQPSYPPAKPPSYLPPRKLVAVQGVVFCKSCKFIGVETLVGAVPLAGAVVKLQCNNTKYGLVEQTKTDKNGYFLFMPQKLTTAAFHKCKVFLVSSPVATCSIPTNLHDGATGAILIPTAKPPAKPTPFQLFTVGPFAFEPPKKCHY